MDLRKELERIYNLPPDTGKVEHAPDEDEELPYDPNSDWDWPPDDEDDEEDEDDPELSGDDYNDEPF